MKKITRLIMFLGIFYSSLCIFFWGDAIRLILYCKGSYAYWEPGVRDWSMFWHALIPVILLTVSILGLILSRKRIRIAIVMTIVLFLGYTLAFYIEIWQNYYALKEGVLHPNWVLINCIIGRSNRPLIYGYVNQKGEIIIKPRFQSGFDFHEGLAVVRKEGKYGYINTKGDIVIQPVFKESTSFNEGLASVVDCNNRSGFINTSGEMVIQSSWDNAASYFEGLAVIIKDRKAGYIDKTGNIVISPQYDKACAFSNGFALVVRDGTYGFIDQKGNILEMENSTIGEAESFSEDFAAVNFPSEKFHWGYIDLEGKLVIPPTFKSASIFSEGIAVVKIKENRAYIDKSGTVVFDVDSGYPYLFSEGLALISIDNKKWPYHRKYIQKYIDKQGKIVFMNNFVRTRDFHDGLARFETRQGKWGYIDKTGKEIIPPRFDTAFDFSEGLACIGVSSKK